MRHEVRGSALTSRMAVAIVAGASALLYRRVRVRRAHTPRTSGHHARGHRLDHANARRRLPTAEPRTFLLWSFISRLRGQKLPARITSQQSKHSSSCRRVCGLVPTDRTRSEDCTEAVPHGVPGWPLATHRGATRPRTQPGAGMSSLDAPGSYTLKAQIVESSTSDPDPADNSTTVTVVVTQSRHRRLRHRLHRWRRPPQAPSSCCPQSRRRDHCLGQCARDRRRNTDQADRGFVHRRACRWPSSKATSEGGLGDCVLPLPHAEVREGKDRSAERCRSAPAARSSRSPSAAKLG